MHLGSALASLADWVSVIGFPLTLVGLWFTYQSVKEAKGAAEKAQREIMKAQEDARNFMVRIASQLLESDVATAIKAIQDATEAGRGRQWERAIEKCVDCRMRLAKLRDHPSLLTEEVDQIRAFVDDLGDLLASFEKLGRTQRQDAEMTQSNIRRMRSIATYLGSLEGRLKDTILRIS